MLSSLFFTELIECSDTPPPPVHAADGVVLACPVSMMARHLEGRT